MSCARPQNNQNGGKLRLRDTASLGKPAKAHSQWRCSEPELELQGSHSQTLTFPELLHTLHPPLSYVQEKHPCPNTVHLAQSSTSESQRDNHFESMSFTQCLLWCPGEKGRCTRPNSSFTAIGSLTGRWV